MFETLKILISKLDPQSVFLLCCLFGVYKMFQTFTKFQRSGEDLVGVLKEIKEDVKKLTIDVAAIVNRVDTHEKRITKLEKP